MVGGEIKVVMTLDNGQFTIQTQKAGQTIQELKKTLDQTATSTERLERHFTGLYGQFRTVIMTASMLRYALHDIHDVFLSLPSAILRTSGEIERMQTLMEGMSKATDEYSRKVEAASNVKFIFNMAQNAPFEVKTLTDAFVKFKSAGLDPTDGSMKALVDSVARFGGSSEAMHRASIAIQQMAGKGVISMEELRQQLGEAVPNAINLMAEGVGMSMPKLTKLISTGTVEASGALKAMFAVMAVENRGAAERMMGTWSGMLNLLKTKFELFKLEAGKSDFFEESKKSLRELIEAFDTNEAKSLAYSIGQGLADAVKVVTSVIKFFKEWGDEIKTVGTLFLLYFAGQKIAAFGEAISAAVQKQKAAFNDKIAKIREAALEEAKAHRQEIANREAQAAALIKNANLQTQMAGKLYAEQAQYARQVADLERRNLGWAGQVRIDRLNARIAETRAAIVDIQTEAVARRQQAQELIRVSEAQRRVADAITNGTKISRADIIIVNRATEEARKGARALGEKAKKATEAGFAVSGMTKAMAGAEMIFNAFGGWVGVAVTVLGWLTTKLFEFLNRWERAEQIAKRIKQGIAEDGDPKEIAARIAEKNQQIASLERMLNKARPELNGADPKSTYGQNILAQQKLYDEQIAQLKKAREERAALIANLGDTGNLLEKQNIEQDVGQWFRRLRADIDSKYAATNKQIEDIRRETAEKQEALRNKPGATTEDFEKVAKEGAERAKALRKQLVAGEIEAYQQEASRLTAALNRANTDSERNVIQAKLKRLTDEREGLIAQAKNLAVNLETGGINTLPKPPKDKPIDPLLRYVESVENDLAVGKLRLEANAEGVRSLVNARNEAVAKVLGDVAEGRFDRTVEDKDGNQKRVEIGGEKRVELVQNFVKALQNGTTTAEQYIKSLKGIDQADKDLILRAIEATAELNVLREQQQALSNAQQQAARTKEDLSEAMARSANNGANAESSAMITLRKNFEALGQKIKAGTDDFKAFQKAKAEALANQAQTDALGFIEDQREAVRNLSVDWVRAFGTESQARQAEYEAALREINDKEKARIASLERVMQSEELSAGRRKELEQQVADVRAAAEKGREALAQRAVIANMTAMQKLRQEWEDSGRAMREVTAKWSRDFVDKFVEATTGGKVSWREFLRDMVKDVYTIFIKKNLGGLITDMFGSLGKTVGDFLGLNDGSKLGQTADNPMYVKDVSGIADVAKGGKEGIFKEAENELVKVWDVLKNGMSSTWDWVTTNISSLFNGAVDWLGSIFSNMGGGGGGGIFSTIASFFGFADGGIMTEFGPAPLKKYLNGGIANSPQLALFGEGSMPEAYVPLPDGRTIPVTVQGNLGGGGGGGTVVQISIQVNNDGSEVTTGNNESDWSQLAQRVKGVVLEEMVNQQRPGGVLYR